MIKRAKLIFILSICILFKVLIFPDAEGRNPFSSQLPVKKASEVVKEEKKEVPRPQISIAGLVWQSSMPQAIINNRVVKIGDKISEDMTVIDLSKEGVIIEYQGETFFYPSGMLTPMKQ